MFIFMALRRDSNQPKKNSLENLSLIELFEKFANELITYRSSLVTENYPDISAEQINEHKKEKYLQKTKELREEINRREQLYLQGHRANIRY
jgi:hypothetical protein